jgi:hypothetical protein
MDLLFRWNQGKVVNIASAWLLTGAAQCIITKARVLIPFKCLSLSNLDHRLLAKYLRRKL